MPTDAQVEAAARVLWDGDAREPYRAMADRMLEAAEEAQP